MDLFDIVFYVVAIGFVIYFCIRKRTLEKMEDEIIKTRIVDVQSRSKSTTRTSTSSAVKRAAVGGALLGKKGAEYGAYTAKKRTVTESDDIVVFRVWWADGSKTTEKVRRGSDRYDLFLEYLDD